MSNEANRADEQSLIVNQLIAEFMSRTDAGENLDVSQFLSEHPEHAAELEKHFANVDLLEGLKETGQQGHDETIMKSDADSEQSTDDATANTIVRGGTDSETSVTRDFERRDTEKTEVAIPENFGRYAIQKVLGQGAMGAVYLARDTQLDRDVALKIPKFDDSNGVDDEELLERFYREARASATLRSPNICPVHDVGEIDGQHYITMAYIEGRPLKDFTKSKKRHSEKQIATTIRKLAQGLAEAHEIGVIHRDLKPANIMVDLKGEPVVMDFGLARRSSSDDVQVTQSGAILGTPAYMAPEQVAGDQAAINHQVDIYALGVIMYELITGEMPFKGNLMAILQQIALNNPTKPSEIRDNLDPRLEKICLKMMAGDQKKRYQSMNDVAADLQDVIKHPNRKQKKEAAQKTGPKPKAIPTAYEESNPALISVEQPKSYAEQLRKKKSKPSSKSAKSSTRLPVTSPTDSGGNKQKLLIAGGLGGLILLLGIVFLVRVGKYDVQITLDDPSITLSVDGEVLNIKDGQDTYQLSAGEHKLQLQKDGLKTHVEEFTVSKDGKTALIARVVNGKLDGLINGERTPQIAESPQSDTLQATATGWHNWPADAPPPAIAPFDTEQAKTHQQAWAKYLDIPVEYENSIGMKFRLIPPGEFTMGSTPEEIAATLEAAGDNESWRERINSEAPQHKVVLTQPHYIGISEVTQIQYEQVMGNNPSHFSASGVGKEEVTNLDTGNHPVEMVSWNDAAEFCAQLSQQEGLRPFYDLTGKKVASLEGNGYRLPTEAEWEFACRAGTTTRFWSGNEDEHLISAAWVGQNSDKRTHAVSTRSLNPFGLSDVHGNVWEWVQDSWIPSFYSRFEEIAVVDPSSLFSTSPLRVRRGGHWSYMNPLYCRSSHRDAPAANRRDSITGFRAVLPVDAVKEGSQQKNASSTGKVTKGWPADAPSAAIAPFDSAQAKAHQRAWADYLGVPVEYENSIGMKFQLIPPGEFLMGSTAEEIEAALKDNERGRKAFQSEEPQHKVVLTQPIYVGVTEVTQTQYEQVVGTNPSAFSPTGESKDVVAGLETGHHPVDSVSWNDAAEFCAKLSQQENLKPVYVRSGETVTPLDGTGYRLPTEAEWEFTCRAGTTTRYYSGDKVQDLDTVGWHTFNSGGRTHAVGELKANPFGLSDLHGNVAEWVQDSWDPAFYGNFKEDVAIDPVSPFSAGTRRVLRGGRWGAHTMICRSSGRASVGPLSRPRISCGVTSGGGERSTEGRAQISHSFGLARRCSHSSRHRPI